MRVAVAGGTGAVGVHTVEALKRSGHVPVVLARSRGVDLSSGTGLDGALTGVDAVIDVTNFRPEDPAATQSLFDAATRHLLAAEQRAQVRHHVLLSIAGVDRIEGNAHYAGKRAQEKLVSSGPIPFTIVRATQFHDFPAMVVGWVRKGDAAIVPPLLLQPIAVNDVATILAEVATASPLGRPIEVGGPEPQDFVDMARRTLAARGESLRLVPSWRNGVFGLDAAGEVMLAAPDARLAPTTFDAWLEEEGRVRR
jgi:uncharacterized protein YbjT (DUF2867 family)